MASFSVIRADPAVIRADPPELFSRRTTSPEITRGKGGTTPSAVARAKRAITFFLKRRGQRSCLMAYPCARPPKSTLVTLLL
jgi:hypothetical protein